MNLDSVRAAKVLASNNHQLALSGANILQHTHWAKLSLVLRIRAWQLHLLKVHSRHKTHESPYLGRDSLFGEEYKTMVPLHSSLAEVTFSGDFEQPQAYSCCVLCVEPLETADVDLAHRFQHRNYLAQYLLKSMNDASRSG